MRRTAAARRRRLFCQNLVGRTPPRHPASTTPAGHVAATYGGGGANRRGAPAPTAVVCQTTVASSNGSIQNFPPVLVEKSELLCACCNRCSSSQSRLKNQTRGGRSAVWMAVIWCDQCFPLSLTTEAAAARRLPTPRTPQSAYSFTSYSVARRTPRAATVVIESILKQLRAMAVYGRAVYTTTGG